MATLTGQTIAASYGKLLVTDSNSGLTGTATNIEDGDGTASKLYLSTSTLGIGYSSFTPVADTLLNIETDQDENATCKTLMITNTHAGGNAGPLLELYRNSSSPAAADVMGKIAFTGEDAGSAKHTYASIASSIADPTAGGEDGSLTIQCTTAGTDATTVATFNYLGAGGLIPVDMPGVGGLVVAQHVWHPTTKQTLESTSDEGWEYIHHNLYLKWVQPSNQAIEIEVTIPIGGKGAGADEFIGLGLVGGLASANDANSKAWTDTDTHSHEDNVLDAADFFSEGDGSNVHRSHVRIAQTDEANDNIAVVRFYYYGLTAGAEYIVRVVAADLEEDEGWFVTTGGNDSVTLDTNHSNAHSNFPSCTLKAITVPNTTVLTTAS